MKTIKFFATALAVTTLLASCVKEHQGNPAGDGSETYAGISISIPMNNTRAGGEADIATDEESIVTKLGVFVVGESTLDKLYLTTSTDFEFDDATGIATAKKAIRTTTGSKTIYVVANYTDEIKALIESMGVGAFGKNAMALNEAYFMTAGTSMVMTGSVTKTIGVVSAEDALAAANIVKIDVYRNLAKVAIRLGNSTAATNIVGGGKHQANTLSFGLIAKAKGAWLSNTPTTSSSQATATAYTGVPADAVLSTTAPYWDNFSAIILGTTAANWKLVNAYAASPSYATMNSWYCHENIYSSSDANLYAGSTTTARLRAKYIPDEIVTAYNTATGERTATDNTATTTATTFYRLNDGSYWSQAAYDAAILAGTYQIPAAKFLTYTDGWGYYAILIMDEARVPGVMRNNYYDLAIDAIHGPGSSKEYPEDVIDPIEQESYVSVQVTVKPWWKQSTGHVIQ